MKTGKIQFVAAMLLLGAALQPRADSARTDEHDYDAPVPGTYTLPVVKPAADGAVLDSQGNALRLRELTRGRVTVMSFIYTRCASACRRNTSRSPGWSNRPVTSPGLTFTAAETSSPSASVSSSVTRW